jgi:hypothetical protein
MTYSKPEVALSGVALHAVQGVNKQPIKSTDSDELQFTTGAYEADE